MSTSFILGYHGCKKSVADALLGGEQFKHSQNSYDWLGAGIYFWQSNPVRARQFAEEVKHRRGGDWETAVVGAVIEPGLCLDLASEAGARAVGTAYSSLVEIYEKTAKTLPTNGSGKDRLKRDLDCKVIQLLHDMRTTERLEPIDTVSGIFVEGEPIYKDSGFYAKTHIQICVCNHKRIKGVFRVAKADIEA